MPISDDPVERAPEPDRAPMPPPAPDHAVVAAPATDQDAPPPPDRAIDDAVPTQTAAGPPPPRRHRALFWAAIVVALAGLGGGAALAFTAYAEETSAEQVVMEYLTALADGDAAAALAYGDIPEGDRDLLTEEVLAVQLAIAPIRNFSVDVPAVSGDVASAEINYELGFEAGPVTIDDTLQLVRDGRTWRIAEVAVPVTMRVTNGASRATLAGAQVPAGTQLVFPGALPISFDTENLGLAEESRVVRFAEEGDLEESAELSAAGEAAVSEALDAAFQACLDGTAAAPTLCPLPEDARAVPGSLAGTVTEPASEVVLIETAPGNDGLVRIFGEVTVTGDYQQLDFNNQRVVKTGAHVIELRAACYVTSPEMIIWRTS